MVCGTIFNVVSKLRPFGRSKQSLPKLNVVAASLDSETGFVDQLPRIGRIAVDGTSFRKSKLLGVEKINWHRVARYGY